MWAWCLDSQSPWVVEYFLFVILCSTIREISLSHLDDKTRELTVSLGSAQQVLPLRPCATFLAISGSLQRFCGPCNDVDLLIPPVYQCSNDWARGSFPLLPRVVGSYPVYVKWFFLSVLQGRNGCQRYLAIEGDTLTPTFCGTLGKHMQVNDL